MNGYFKEKEEFPLTLDDEQKIESWKRFRSRWVKANPTLYRASILGIETPTKPLPRQLASDLHLEQWFRDGIMGQADWAKADPKAAERTLRDIHGKIGEILGELVSSEMPTDTIKNQIAKAITFARSHQRSKLGIEELDSYQLPYSEHPLKRYREFDVKSQSTHYLPTCIYGAYSFRIRMNFPSLLKAKSVQLERVMPLISKEQLRIDAEAFFNDKRKDEANAQMDSKSYNQWIEKLGLDGLPDG